MPETIFIGIAGGTGSGKTTLTAHIKERFYPPLRFIHEMAPVRHHLPGNFFCQTASNG